ncbi:hypothetical protein ACFLZ1_03560 [Patescibacteria group bacterium]
MKKILKIVSVFLGLASIVFFVFNYFVFINLQPKMISFKAVSVAEEGLMNWVGVGLLIFLVFCLVSLFKILKYLKNAKKITLFSIFLVAIGVLSLLFIFADIALLSDIGKQYRHGLAQPEWLMIYPIMGFQFMSAVIFTYFHVFGFKKENQVKLVIKDSNIFLIVQYVGIICGLMGLSLSSLGFLFPRAWSLQTHTTLSSIMMLIPYFLVVIFWFLIKIQEKTRQWYDEKQIQDVGKSAFLTMTISVVYMLGLFITNYNNLGGVVSILWLPLYLFLTLFIFSIGNLYFTGKN